MVAADGMGPKGRFEVLEERWAAFERAVQLKTLKIKENSSQTEYSPETKKESFAMFGAKYENKKSENSSPEEMELMKKILEGVEKNSEDIKKLEKKYRKSFKRIKKEVDYLKKSKEKSQNQKENELLIFFRRKQWIDLFTRPLTYLVAVFVALAMAAYFKQDTMSAFMCEHLSINCNSDPNNIEGLSSQTSNEASSDSTTDKDSKGLTVPQAGPADDPGVTPSDSPPQATGSGIESRSGNSSPPLRRPRQIRR